MKLIRNDNLDREITEKYSNNVWDIYTKGIDKRGKSPVRLWFIFIPFALFILSGAFWLHNNQGKVFISYHEAKQGSWLCDNESWVDLKAIDDLRVKKIRLKEVQESPGDCWGLKKDSLKYSYTDLDNDGKYEVVFGGEWDNGDQVKYFLKVNKDDLSIIPVKGQRSREKLKRGIVNLDWPDERGKYTFAAETVIHYSHTIFRDLYHFNDKGEIELYRRETEELTGDASKFGPIAEIPLR